MHICKKYNKFVCIWFLKTFRLFATVSATTINQIYANVLSCSFYLLLFSVSHQV